MSPYIEEDAKGKTDDSFYEVDPKAREELMLLMCETCQEVTYHDGDDYTLVCIKCGCPS